MILRLWIEATSVLGDPYTLSIYNANPDGVRVKLHLNPDPDQGGKSLNKKNLELRTKSVKKNAS